MTLRLPYILKWSCSELGLSLHPLHQTTLLLFLLVYTNNPICCGNKAIYKGGRLIHCGFIPAVMAWNASLSAIAITHRAFLCIWVSSWLIKLTVCHHFLDFYSLALASVTSPPHVCVWACLSWCSDNPVVIWPKYCIQSAETMTHLVHIAMYNLTYKMKDIKPYEYSNNKAFSHHEDMNGHRLLFIFY